MLEALLGLFLLLASALVTWGCYLICPPAAFIVGGALLAAVAVLFLWETS